MIHNLESIFPTDPFLDSKHPKHPKHYCNLTTNNIPEELDSYSNDGISLKLDHCYCGNKIIIKKLQNTVTRYKFCHCGAAYDYINYGPNTWLCVCMDSECLCVQDVCQQTQKLIGKPCNTICKTLRFVVGDMLIVNKSENSISKEQIECMGISDCVKVLSVCNEE